MDSQWIPANASEFMDFVNGRCGRCRNGIDEGCEIYGRGLDASAGFAPSPNEWRVDDNRLVTCTGFERRHQA